MDLVVGRVVRAHGVSGELVVEVRTDDPDSRFAAGSTLRGKPASGGSAGEYTVESVREHNGRLLVRLAGVAAPEGNCSASAVTTAEVKYWCRSSPLSSRRCRWSTT